MNLRSIIVPCLLLDQSLAELSFAHLKGIEKLVSDPAASPLVGYVALKTYMPNYRFLGNYGAVERGFFCTHPRLKLRKRLLAREDCPRDQVSELIQRLFPSTDGQNFTANQLLTDRVSRLHPGLIGKIIGRLVRADEAELVDPQGFENFINDLTDILYSDLNQKGFIQHKLEKVRRAARRTGHRIEGLVPWIKANWESLPASILMMEARTVCQWGLKKAHRVDKDLKLRIAEFGGIEAFCLRLVEDREFLGQETLVPEWLSGMLVRMHSEERVVNREYTEIYNLLKREEITNGEKKSQSGDYEEFLEIGRLIAEAVKEARGLAPVSNGFLYRRHLPEEALLAYMIRRIDTKAELIPYFRAIPELIQNRDFHSEGWESAFSSDVWSLSETDYPEFVEDVHFGRFPDPQAPGEHIVYRHLLNKLSVNILPPLVHMGTAQYKEGTLSVSYPDCGETSLRNLFNIMLFNKDTGQYDLSVFDQLENSPTEEALKYPRLRFSPALREFYARHPAPTDTMETLRHEWALEIVARRPGVIYKVGLKDEKESEQEPEVLDFEIRAQGRPWNMFKLLGNLLFDAEGEAQWNSLTGEVQVKALCALFSREGFDLKCSYWESSPASLLPSARISVMINDGAGRFHWDFQNGHFSIHSGEETSAASHRELGIGLFMKNDSRINPVLPILFSDEKDMTHRAALFLKTDLQRATAMLLSAAYVSLDARRDFFAKVMRFELPIRNLVSPFIKRLMHILLQSNDTYTKDFVGRVLLEAGFPFGVPKELDPSVSGFRKLSPIELASVFPSSDFAWSTEIFGSRVIIPPAAMRDARYWQEGQNDCLNLNDYETMPKIQRQVLAREERLKAVRGLDVALEITPEIERIYREHPITGYAPLGTEQWMVLGDSDFTRRIIPFLGTYVWSTQPGMSVSLERNTRSSQFTKSAMARVQCAWFGPSDSADI
jgi:hypothetical protein